MNGGLLGTILVGAAFAFCWFVFGLPLWLVLQAPLIYAAFTLKGFGSSAGFILMMTFTAYGFSVYLFGLPIYVNAIAGVVAILLITAHFNQPKTAVVAVDDGGAF